MHSPSLPIELLRRDRITPISSAVHRRPIVLVLGMHRSGTSLCAHILSALGVDMADKLLIPGHSSMPPDNLRGHWERWEIVEFHDRILSLFNRVYSGHFHDFALPVAWWADPQVVQIKREIIVFLEQRMGSGYFGFKDPRTVRLMPMWYQIFNELKLTPKIVLCLRNPAQIGRSLNAREGLNSGIGEYRWFVHLTDFFRYMKNYDYCTVEYEEWFRKPSINLNKLQQFLNLPWQQSEADLSLLPSGIVDPGLRHDNANNRGATQPLVRTFYELVGRSDQDEARDQIISIVSHFITFQQLQRPLLQVFEELAQTAAKFPEVEQEAMTLRKAVSERDEIVETANVRAVRAEVGLAEALLEIDQLRAQIAELVREVDALRGVKATLAEHEAEEQSRRENELAEALQVLLTQLPAYEAALRQVKQEGAAATAAFAAELRGLRERLAQTECERNERAGAAAALQAEIMTLRSGFAAAREVAKVAITAFRVHAAAPAKPYAAERLGTRHIAICRHP